MQVQFISVYTKYVENNPSLGSLFSRLTFCSISVWEIYALDSCDVWDYPLFTLFVHCVYIMNKFSSNFAVQEMRLFSPWDYLRPGYVHIWLYICSITNIQSQLYLRFLEPANLFRFYKIMRRISKRYISS